MSSSSSFITYYFIYSSSHCYPQLVKEIHIQNIHKIHSTHHYYIWTIYQRISPVPQNAKQQNPLAGSPTKQASGIEWKVDMKPLVKQKSSHQLVVYFFGIYPHPSTNRDNIPMPISSGRIPTLALLSDVNNWRLILQDDVNVTNM